MIQRMKKQLGTAGLALAVLSLIVALAGTALAAKGVFTKSQEKQIVKIAKRYAGKDGATGPAGPQGAAGAPGAKGDAGARGPEGPEGEPGQEGEPGSPWTAGGTLPSGESLYGHWAGYSTELALVPISFDIPLSAAPTGVVVGASGSAAEGCPGTAAAPAADAGKFCIYDAEEESSFAPGFGASPDANGGVLQIAGGYGNGTWAVTAP